MSGRALSVERKSIGETTPIPLQLAVDLAFPGGGMTVSGLRRSFLTGGAHHG